MATQKRSKYTIDGKGNDLHLVVHETREGNTYNGGHYFHLRAAVCTQRFEDHAWVPQGVDDTYSDQLLWSNLRVSCQGDERSQLRAIGAGESGPVYGFDTEYRDVYHVDRRTARRMVKTLDKVAAGLEKIQEARGYVRSYGEYVGRVAEVLGCAGICLQREKTAYNGSCWEWVSIGDGVNRVNHRIYLWQQEAVARGQQLETEVAS